MTKAVIGNKEESTKKQIKKQSRKKQESFSKEGAVASYGAQKSRKVFKGKNSFLMSLEKQKRCHNSKEANFDLERA